MSQTQLSSGGVAVEQNGINVIAEDERKGKPSDLFWPWCAANISVLAISYGSFVVGFAVSTQPPWSTATSTMTDPGFMSLRSARLTR